jgi:hypothetical protein
LNAFGEEVKLPHVVRLYSILKIPEEYDSDTFPAKLTDISHQGFPYFATRCLCGYFQRVQVDESGMTRTQMRKHNRSENGRSAWGA